MYSRLSVEIKCVCDTGQVLVCLPREGREWGLGFREARPTRQSVGKSTASYAIGRRPQAGY